jgi:MarR family 2-MHQ and catechol resistance regulon transcriptional repressor
LVFAYELFSIGVDMKQDGIITSDQQFILTTYVKMMRAMGVVTTRMHRHLAQFKLTVSQFGVLETLYHLGPLYQKEIGQKILKTRGNMTMVIDNLEKRDLVVRENDPNDRRHIRVRLTTDGENLICHVFPRHAKIAAQVFSALDADELAQLGFLMKKLGMDNTQ